LLNINVLGIWSLAKNYILQQNQTTKSDYKFHLY
jgi:hypothetical protein